PEHLLERVQRNTQESLRPARYLSERPPGILGGGLRGLTRRTWPHLPVCLTRVVPCVRHAGRDAVVSLLFSSQEGTDISGGGHEGPEFSVDRGYRGACLHRRSARAGEGAGRASVVEG